MKKEDYYKLGKLIKPHALKGEVSIFLDVDNPNYYKKLKSIFLDINGRLKEFNVERLHLHKKKNVIKLKGVDSIEQAEEILKTDVYLPLSALPKLGKNQFYYHDIIGFEVYNEEEILGEIIAIYETAGQDLFGIDVDGKEVLVPITDDFILEINLDDRFIRLELPDGLLDLYLDE